MMTDLVVEFSSSADLTDTLLSRFKRIPGASFGDSQDFVGHVAKQSRGHRAHERSKIGLRQLVVERFVGQRGVKARVEGAVEIRQGFDAMARTGRRQCEVQAKRRNGPLAPTKLRVF